MVGGRDHPFPTRMGWAGRDNPPPQPPPQKATPPPAPSGSGGVARPGEVALGVAMGGGAFRAENRASEGSAASGAGSPAATGRGNYGGREFAVRIARGTKTVCGSQWEGGRTNWLLGVRGGGLGGQPGCKMMARQPLRMCSGTFVSCEFTRQIFELATQKIIII